MRRGSLWSSVGDATEEETLKDKMELERQPSSDDSSGPRVHSCPEVEAKRKEKERQMKKLFRSNKVGVGDEIDGLNEVKPVEYKSPPTVPPSATLRIASGRSEFQEVEFTEVKPDSDGRVGLAPGYSVEDQPNPNIMKQVANGMRVFGGCNPDSSDDETQEKKVEVAPDASASASSLDAGTSSSSTDEDNEENSKVPKDSKNKKKGVIKRNASVTFEGDHGDDGQRVIREKSAMKRDKGAIGNIAAVVSGLRNHEQSNSVYDHNRPSTSDDSRYNSGASTSKGGYSKGYGPSRDSSFTDATDLTSRSDDMVLDMEGEESEENGSQQPPIPPNANVPKPFLTDSSLEIYKNIHRNGVSKQGKWILGTSLICTFVVTIVLAVLILIIPKTLVSSPDDIYKPRVKTIPSKSLSTGPDIETAAFVKKDVTVLIDQINAMPNSTVDKTVKSSSSTSNLKRTPLKKNSKAIQIDKIDMSDIGSRNDKIFRKNNGSRYSIAKGKFLKNLGRIRKGRRPEINILSKDETNLNETLDELKSESAFPSSSTSNPLYYSQQSSLVFFNSTVSNHKTSYLDNTSVSVVEILNEKTSDSKINLYQSADIVKSTLTNNESVLGSHVQIEKTAKVFGATEMPYLSNSSVSSVLKPQSILTHDNDHNSIEQNKSKMINIQNEDDILPKHSTSPPEDYSNGEHIQSLSSFPITFQYDSSPSQSFTRDKVDTSTTQSISSYTQTDSFTRNFNKTRDVLVNKEDKQYVTIVTKNTGLVEETNQLKNISTTVDFLVTHSDELYRTSEAHPSTESTPVNNLTTTDILAEDPGDSTVKETTHDSTTSFSTTDSTTITKVFDIKSTVLVSKIADSVRAHKNRNTKNFYDTTLSYPVSSSTHASSVTFNNEKPS